MAVLLIQLLRGQLCLMDLDGDFSFSRGIGAEDQSAHRAEVEALLAVFSALSRCKVPGTVRHGLSDCLSAIDVSRGLGSTTLMAGRFVQLRNSFARDLELVQWRVPSHNKPALRGWSKPVCGEAQARAFTAIRQKELLNNCAALIAQGSLRSQCARRDAAAWERQALSVLHSVSAIWAEA